MSAPSYRIINILGVMIFAIFAWLQREDDNPEIYSDPSLVDVWAWIIFYSLVALGFLAASLQKFPRWIYIISLVLAVYFMVVSAPGLYENLTRGQIEMTKAAMHPDYPHVEQSREFLGALIAFLATAFLWWQYKFASHNR